MLFFSKLEVSLKIYVKTPSLLPSILGRRTVSARPILKGQYFITAFPISYRGKTVL